MNTSNPIGIFDSGYGGLTILKEIKKTLPDYDYIYLGDNARTPYGNRSFDTVYEYTLECVNWLFSKGCPLIILACNTASAKALRTIQQKYLPQSEPGKRVLGVIRPTAEIIGNYSSSNQIGILATRGTVQSESYLIEIEKFFPSATVFQQACPMWVPLIENNEYENAGADYFVKKDLEKLLAKSSSIDTVLLACTHYPLLIHTIKKHLPTGVKVISQGPVIAASLKDYLARHPEIESKCSRNTKGSEPQGKIEFFTTDSATDFDRHSKIFFGEEVNSRQVTL